MIPKTYRTLLALAWPIVLARASQSVVGFADALMVAPLGEAALAGVTTGAINMSAIVILPIGTVIILQSFAAQLRGRGELGAVRRYAWYGLALAMVAELLALGAVPFVRPLFGMLDYAPEVHDAMSTYLAIRLVSVGFIVGQEALANWYGGLGHTRVAMVTGLVTMGANLVFNYLLIEPRFGLPGWGVAGAAWASLIASALGFVVVLAMFLRGLGLESFAGTAVGRLRAAELWRVVRFGLPNGVNWFLESAAFVLFLNVVVAHMGTTVLAAFNVVMQLNAMSFMPAFGIGSAGAILVGEAIGARRHDDVWPIVRRTGVLTCSLMGGIGLLYVSMPHVFIGLFESSEAPAGELVQAGATMLGIAALWQLFDALGMTFAEALRAAGDTTWSMLARIGFAWTVFVPGAWVAVRVFEGGIVSMMLALVAYLALLAAAFAWRFWSGRWRHIEMVGSEPELV